LVEGVEPDLDRRFINDKILKLFPTVEQVGFYSCNKDKAILEMAGGEFCGNALRSLAYLLLGGKKGEASFDVLGVSQKLKAGVGKRYTAYTQIPIEDKPDMMKRVDSNLWQVDLEGISQLIVETPFTLYEEKAKSIAKDLLAKTGLLAEKPASGVMFVKKTRLVGILEVEPVVFVRKIQTFFYETACASGTAAVGIWYSKKTGLGRTLLKVKQPSKEMLEVEVRKSMGRIVNVNVEGPVKILKRVEVVL
jgi:diaminopimelate epimerase